MIYTYANEHALTEMDTRTREEGVMAGWEGWGGGGRGSGVGANHDLPKPSQEYGEGGGAVKRRR